jgi:hypothetical protein
MSDQVKQSTTTKTEVTYPLPYSDVYTEIKGGIWAVALAFVVIWLATANIRRSLGVKLGKVIDEHLELVNDTQAITKDTNDRVKDIQKKVDDFLS